MKDITKFSVEEFNKRYYREIDEVSLIYRYEYCNKMLEQYFIGHLMLNRNANLIEIAFNHFRKIIDFKYFNVSILSMYIESGSICESSTKVTIIFKGEEK